MTKSRLLVCLSHARIQDTFHVAADDIKASLSESASEHARMDCRHKGREAGSVCLSKVLLTVNYIIVRFWGNVKQSELMTKAYSW